jgi:plasmid stabilization system protein ParE
MQVAFAPRFYQDMLAVWYYIAMDSPAQADRFKQTVREQTARLVDMPFRNRPSIYFDDPNVRDLIVKGYVLPYRIDQDAKTITVLGMTKYRKNF